MTTILSPQFDEAAVRQAAEACGARFADDPHGPQAVIEPAAAAAAAGPADLPAHGAAAPAAPAACATAAGRVALLPDWGIVSVSGDDAVKFLHAQTTNDIEKQPADEVRWNGYCTPKGRLLAGGPLWRDGDALNFAVSRPLAAPLRKRLSMFVLRSKAKVEDASDACAILGLAGEPAAAALRELGIDPPAPMRCARTQRAPAGEADAAGANDAARTVQPIAIGFAPVEGIGPRWWLVVPADRLASIWQALAARLAPASSDWWRATEILAGEPRIVPATSEAFVPQTLNWN